MRMLMSASTFPLVPDDGLPRFILDLCEAMSSHGEVTALVPDAPGARRRERLGGVEVRRFTYFLPRRWQALAYGHGIADNLRRSFVAKLQPLPYVIAQARATRALVRERNIQVVNSHWLVPQGLSSALARGSRRRFIHVVTLHGGDAYILHRLPFGRRLARFIIGRADFVFAVSTNVRDQLDALLDAPSGAVIRPVGVGLDRFRDAELVGAESPFPGGYLLFVGRLHEIKGIEYLLRALPEVEKHHPGLGLVVVGYGPHERALRREVEQLGLEGSVEFVGARSHREVAAYLRGCRVAVVPSVIEKGGRTEGMPTVVVEAMAAGARVVGSAVGGIRDVIRHGENGWLCAPRDPSDLAAKLLLALADPEDSDVLRQAEATADTFDWPVVAARYAQAFEELMRVSPPEGGAARAADVIS